ncbi:MAG: hypothetical protein ACPIG6_07860 [Akkermansiaceae bacterium]
MNQQQSYNLMVELGMEIHLGNLVYDTHINELVKYAKQAGLDEKQIDLVKNRIKEHPQES